MESDLVLKGEGRCRLWEVSEGAKGTGKVREIGMLRLRRRGPTYDEHAQCDEIDLRRLGGRHPARSVQRYV